MFVTTLGMENFDCTKMNAHFKKIHSLSTGGTHSQVEASITSPTSAPDLAKQLTALFHTHCSAFFFTAKFVVFLLLSPNSLKSPQY